MKRNLLLFLILLIVATSCFAAGERGVKRPAHSVGCAHCKHYADQQKIKEDAELVIRGMVVRREEIWDRRSNEMLGRPDQLKEIVLQIKILEVIKGSTPPTNIITISIKGRDQIITHKGLAQGTRGKFYLAGEKPPFVLVGTGDIIRPKPKPLPKPRPKPKPRPFPENIGGIEMKKSPQLQKRAVDVIAKKYNMKDAQILFLVSNSGPRPPSGGYVYWGVKGQIDGKWHVWQFGKLHEGQKLIDPKRYQK
ncbi:hypothetical protein ACFL5G_02830 [Candidatus Margulisiibacteriota bacterium]